MNTDATMGQRKAPSLESQKLALDFANEVANARLIMIAKMIQQVEAGDVLPVDALFEIRKISGKQG